jgi:predicted ATPase/DNA-binding SARP family transcriptional activator
MADSTLRVYLLGTLEIFQGDTPLSLPGSSVARSLLAYLCLHREHPISRAVLVGTFWPEFSESRARRALSQALWHIRQVIPQQIESDSYSIHLPLETPLWVDVAAFQELTKSNPVGNTTGIGCQADNLRQAVALYRGDLLEGFYDDWVLIEREVLWEQYLQTLEALIHIEKSAGKYSQALEWAQALVQADPLQEAAHRELMRIYFALDRPESALRQFEICQQVLIDELGVEPELETAVLAQEIANRAPSNTPPYLPQPTRTVSPLEIDRTQPVQIALVGRKRERNELVTCIEGLFDSAGGVTLVEGDAGVGKTRLLQEVSRDAQWRNVQVLWGRCREIEGLLPFAPLLEALEDGLSPLRISQLTQLVDAIWLQALQALLPKITADLSDPPPLPELAPAQARARLVDAFTQVLMAWGQVTPLMLVVEDLHWADADSLDLLVTLAQRILDQRILIVASYRGEDARSFPAIWEKLQALDRSGLRCRLILTSLDASASGELIRSSLRLASPAPLFEERLHQETGGNPLFLFETLRSLLEEGFLQQNVDGSWHTPFDQTTSSYAELPLPEAVERIIARRLTHIPPQVQETMQLAAILGERFDFAVLRAASEKTPADLLAALHELVQRRFLIETPQEYQFSHHKVREVVYQFIAETERQRLHRQVGDALEIQYPDRIPALAYHFYQAQTWDKAANYCQQAGDQAAAVYANQDALVHYSRVLEAIVNLPVENWAEPAFSARIARTKILNRLAEREQQLCDLKALDEALNDQNTFGTQNQQAVALEWGNYYEGIGDFAAAIKTTEAVCNAAQNSGDLRLATETMVNLGNLLKNYRNYEGSLQRLEEAYALAQSINDRTNQTRCLHRTGWIYFERGQFDTAMDYYQRALESYQEEDDPLILAAIHRALGAIYHYLADFPRSLEHHRKALRICQLVGNRRLEITSLYNSALTYNDSGDKESAQQLLIQVCELSKAIGDKSLEGYGWVFLGVVYEETGQYPLARQAYLTGLASRRETGLHALANDPLAGLARVATAEGKHAEAVEYAHQVLDWIDEHGYEGIGDPLLAYVGVYQALLAGQEADHQLGLAILNTDYDLLMKFAENISDPERRRAYIHDISPGVSIWNDYQTYIAGKTSRQIQVQLPHMDAPTGRPLRDDEWVVVNWTITDPEDDLIEGKAARRHRVLLRLMDQVQAQGGAPTIDDLASALGVSRATIKRDLATLREQGYEVVTRGSRE